jgi:AraC family transcriptional regulator
VNPADPVRKALRLKAEHGASGSACGRILAEGQGWRAQDVICSSGPSDRPFEERHEWVSIAVVLSGTFTYGNDFGRALLSPGALLLGDAGGCFTCAHEHGEGDRCLSFHFDPALFEDIAKGSGALSARFARNSLPAQRGLAPLTARATQAIGGTLPLEELGLELAAAALRECTGGHRLRAVSKRDERRVTAVVRHLEESFGSPCELSELAGLAGLSRFHFLRVFRATTGLTPHQYLLRTRLRAAAGALAGTPTPVTEVALDAGFDDLSNFVRTFRAEYGMSPTRYRAAATRR